MKIRWRTHEAALIAIVVAIIVKGYVWQMLQQVNCCTIYVAPFITAHLSFNYYYTHVLFPQIGSVILLWLVYIWINRVTIPALTTQGKNWIIKVLALVVQVVLIAYIIGPCVNFASFYINPYYGAGGWIMPLTFGYHSQPLKNAFGGMNEAFFMLALYAIYALFRELSIYYFDREDERRSYRILILNQTTMFLVFLFASPVFLSSFRLVTDASFYHYYFYLTLPAFATFTFNVYWLLPKKGEKSFFTWIVMGPLLFTTFISTLIFSIFLREDWSLLAVIGNWAALVLIITPISVLDFQQRKDKILQLRGAEKALVKSLADLQFLRSQINPHFLFNALNTLYGTALIEGSKNTAEGIQKLGDMMRFMLHENTMDYIPMEREIEYLKNYMALQKLRTQTSADIIIEDNITDQLCTHQIAPMLLIPFVENAFKHGISHSEKSWIKIMLECDEQHISFEVRNSVHKVQDDDPEKGQSGIGLKNVRERLQILYPHKHVFTSGVEGNEFVANLQLTPITGKVFKKAINLNRVWNA